MKKRIAAAALALALALSLPGCGAAQSGTAPAVDEEVLTICIESDMHFHLKDLGKLFHKLHPDVLVVFEQLPSINYKTTPRQLEEREAALTRVSAQVMAGKGPDLFLLEDELYGYAQAMGSRALFPDLCKSMTAGVFADWNAIIEESGQPLPEDYLPPLLEAGRMDGSQYLLPLSCDVYGLLADAALWADDLPAMAAAPNFTALMDLVRAGGSLDLTYKGGALELSKTFLLSAGIPAVDYGAGQVLLTPQALAPQLAAMEEAAAVDEERRQREGYDTIEHYALSNRGLAVGKIGPYDLLLAAALASSGDEPRDTRVVPIPMEDGGTAAYMRHWAGVRANSEQKQNAWAFVQFLLSEELQSGGQIKRGDRFYGSPGTFGDALPARAGCWREKLGSAGISSFGDRPVQDPSPETLDSAAAIAGRVTKGAAYGGLLQKASAALMGELAGPQPFDLAGALQAETSSWGTYLDE